LWACFQAAGGRYGPTYGGGLVGGGHSGRAGRGTPRSVWTWAVRRGRPWPA